MQPPLIHKKNTLRKNRNPCPNPKNAVNLLFAVSYVLRQNIISHFFRSSPWQMEQGGRGRLAAAFQQNCLLHESRIPGFYNLLIFAYFGLKIWFSHVFPERWRRGRQPEQRLLRRKDKLRYTVVIFFYYYRVDNSTIPQKTIKTVYGELRHRERKNFFPLKWIVWRWTFGVCKMKNFHSQNVFRLQGRELQEQPQELPERDQGRQGDAEQGQRQRQRHGTCRHGTCRHGTCRRDDGTW